MIERNKDNNTVVRIVVTIIIDCILYKQRLI